MFTEPKAFCMQFTKRKKKLIEGWRGEKKKHDAKLCANFLILMFQYELA